MSTETVICGDFNEDYPAGGCIRKLFEELSYSQVITEPTTENQTLLDVIYVSNRIVNDIKYKGIINTYHSYHNGVYCCLKM